MPLGQRKSPWSLAVSGIGVEVEVEIVGFVRSDVYVTARAKEVLRGEM